MLYWQANFQIPNSGCQSEYVFLYAKINESTVTLEFYSDMEKLNLMWSEDIDYFSVDENEIYNYILSQEKYKNYKRIN